MPFFLFTRREHRGYSAAMSERGIDITHPNCECLCHWAASSPNNTATANHPFFASSPKCIPFLSTSSEIQQSEGGEAHQPNM